MVYDITDKYSFENIRKWLFEIERYASQDIQKLLVGNKSDLEDKRQVETNVAQQFAKELGFKFVEASAKNGTFKRINVFIMIYLDHVTYLQ